MKNSRYFSRILKSLGAVCITVLITGMALGQDISVDSQGDPLTSNGAARDLGTVDIGGGFLPTVSFTISGGTQEITLGEVSLAPADHYEIITNPSNQTIIIGNSLTLTARFNPTTHGTHNAVLTIPVAAPAGIDSFHINLTGEGQAPQAGISIDSSGITTPSGGGTLANDAGVTFAATAVGNSTEATFTIENTGNENLGWTNTIIDPSDVGFEIITSSAQATIAPDSNTTLTVRFTPLTAGDKNATLTITTDDLTNPSFTVNLTGPVPSEQDIGVNQAFGDQEQLFDNGAVQSFGDVNFSTTSQQSASERTFRITNRGQLALNINQITVNDGAFSVSSAPTLPAIVAADATIDFTVTFQPTSRGTSQGQVSITSDDPDTSSFEINMNGTGLAPVAQITGSGNFADTVLGSTNTQTFTIGNTGDAELDWTATAGILPNPGFGVQQPSSGTLPPNTSTQLIVAFSPTASEGAGNKAAVLTIDTNDPASPAIPSDLEGRALNAQTIEIRGLTDTGTEYVLNEVDNGNDDELLYSEQDYGAVNFGSNDPAAAPPSVSEIFRVRNNGEVTMNLTEVQVVHDPAITSFENDFAVAVVDNGSLQDIQIGPNGYVDLEVTFSPRADGARVADLVITSNASNGGTVTLPLTGTATSPYVLVKDDDGRNVSAQVPATFPYTPPIEGTQSSLEFDLKNVGSASLHNYQISLVNPSDAFTVTGALDDAGNPTSIPSGTLLSGVNQPFRIEFSPQILDRGITALIQVSSDNHPTYEFQVTGDSRPTPPGAPDAFGYYYDPNGALRSELAVGQENVQTVTFPPGSFDSESINIGFPFFFYASSYTRCGLSPFGVITFDDGAVVGNVPALIPTPESTPPNNFIAPFWGNLTRTANSKILYTTDGQPGGRVLVVQYDNFVSAGAGTLTFQVILKEGSNDIEFHYFSVGPLAATTDTVSIGIQDPYGVGTSYWYGQQDGTSLTDPSGSDGATADGFISSSSVIRFVRPIRSRVVSAYVGKPNDYTRITCPSTEGLQVGMYISGDRAFSQNVNANGETVYPTITEIIDAQTFVISAPPVLDVSHIPNAAGQVTFTSLEAQTIDPGESAAGESGSQEVIINEEYSQNFNDGKLDFDEVLAGRTPRLRNGQLWLSYDRVLSSSLFANTGGRTSISIPRKYGSSQGFTAEFDFILRAAPNQQPADGFSFNYGDAPLGTTGWEEGMQSVPSVNDNLSFEVDTWHNNSGDRGVGIGGVINNSPVDFVGPQYGNILDPVGRGSTHEVGGRATVSWTPDLDGDGGGTANFTTAALPGYALPSNYPNFTQVPTPNFAGNDNYTFNISARIGGANQDLIIDNLTITTVGRTVSQDTSRNVALFNCRVDFDSPDFPENPMLSSVGVNEIDLGFDPLPGGTYTSAYGADKGFTAPEYIYLNAAYEPLSGPGDVPNSVEDELAEDVAVYRLVNDGYSVGGNIVQGANTYFLIPLTQDVTVVWRWRIEYAVFVEGESVRPDVRGTIQQGVGNPIPAVGRHWVPRNTELTATVDRVSGDDFLNSDTGGIRYATVGYDVTTKPSVGEARSTTRFTDIGSTGNRVSASPDQPITDWTIMKWRMMPQVRYRFGAKTQDGVSSGASLQGQAFVESIDMETRDVAPIIYNNGPLIEAWINMGDSVNIGAFHRTADRCFTLVDFPGAQGGDLSALGTSVSELADVVKPDDNNAEIASDRLARVYTVPMALMPTEWRFFYDATIFRAEIPIGEFLDADDPSGLIPRLCNDSSLRAGTDGPGTEITPIGAVPPGKTLGAALRWDQVGRRLLPVQPGIYRVSWPDRDDPSRSYLIEIITGYPGDLVSYPVNEAREVPLGDGSGDSRRETTTDTTSEPVYDNQRNLVDGQFYVTSTRMSYVTADFPGSRDYATLPLDAHYRHLFDDSSARRAPSRLDLLSTDQWNFIEMPFTDTSTNPQIITSEEGTAFMPQDEGRCVLLYSLRPNPDEAASGNLTKEELVARVVRAEEKPSIDVSSSKLVLGNRGLELDDASDLRIGGSFSENIPLGNSFVVDFWLNGSGLRSDNGDVTVFGTSNDTLKVTLSNNRSETTATIAAKPQQISIPFGFSSSADLVATNINTGETLQEGSDYQVTNGSPVGSPNGSVTILDTAATSTGDQVRIQLADPPAPGGRITATYQGTEVTHPFSTTGIDWQHYVIHVFPSSFFGTSITVVDFYQDGIRSERAVVTDTSQSTAIIDPDASSSSGALRFGVGADPRSKLVLDQFRVFNTTSLTKLSTGTSSTDPWLTPEETHALRTERTSSVRERGPVVYFGFGNEPSSGSFPNMGTQSAIEVGPIPVDINANPHFLGYWARNDIQEVATRLTSTLDNAGFVGSGYILNRVSNYNAGIYDRTAQVGSWGPVYPVNDKNLFTAATKALEVAYYENPFRTDPATHPNVAWPYEAVHYDEVQYPTYGAHKDKAIYIASRLGSEGVDEAGKPQEVFSLARYANFKVYNQGVRSNPGFNPNEEHALAASANRAALKIKGQGEDIPNNPPLAAFALQNDINIITPGDTYTSDPWVLVQYDNLSTGEPEMAAYEVHKTRSGSIPFPRPSDEIVSNTNGLEYESAENPEDRFLVLDPEQTYNFTYNFNYEAMAGDLLIPPYPLNRVIGTATMADARGANASGRRSFWRDVNQNAWVVSGDGQFWHQWFYPFRSDFYLPGAAIGASVAWVPTDSNLSPSGFLGNNAVGSTVDDSPKPTKVTYLTRWRSGYPKLKRGESLTYQGGEYFNETPGAQGLPALVAMAAAEIVYDSATPEMIIDDTNVHSYSARIIRPLDRREASFSVAKMTTAGFTPASESTLIVAERWYFTDLPGSLQRRFYYDSLAEKLVFRGYLNDKESGDPELTAGPDPLNILEPNVMTSDEKTKILQLAATSASEWRTAVTTIYDASLAPDPVRRFTPTGTIVDVPNKTGQYFAGVKEIPAVTLNNSGLTASERTRLTRLDNLYGELTSNNYTPFWYITSFFSAPTSHQSTFLELLAEGLTWENGQWEYQADPVPAHEAGQFAHLDSFGTGSALVPSPNLLTDPVTGSQYVTIAENNRLELDGAPVSLHIVEIIPDRYRGALKVIEGADAFSEKITIQHNGEFGANTDDLYYEWWIRDAAPLDVVADEILANGGLAEVDLEGNSLWQQYLPAERAQSTLTEEQKHLGLHSIVFAGRPDVTLADKLILMRYRHQSEQGWRIVPFDYTDALTEWAPAPSTVAGSKAPFQWAGAANSPQLQADGSKRYIPQLVMGWVKRVLDRINPYEARYTDFFGNESPAVYSSQIQIAGGPFAGKVALNPDKNVIENTGLIELYETVLARARELSIDNSTTPVSTDGINQAILLAATRLAVLYEILAREAYSDAQDPTITVAGEEWGLDQVAPYTHAFQNMEASLQHEELALLRGTDFRKSYPVFNRMFWNYAKGLGEAAYNVNYNIQDTNMDGFINEDDGRALYPQGHGDSWGHFLSAMGMHYELLQQPIFQWNSRAELYSLMENVLEVDYLDEKTFAKVAAGKAVTGRDIVRGTYRLHYTQDPDGQWQGYTDDSDPARGWGVSEWAHRTGQAAYFDWAVANTILPEEAENATPVENPENLDLIERSTAKDEIGMIAAGLLEIQLAMDEANAGVNPLGFDSDTLAVDLNVEFYENASGGDRRSHFEQIHTRAVTACNNALTTLALATGAAQKLRNRADDTDALMVAAFEQDLDFRNSLIEIFGRPYDGQIGVGKAYPEGYLGPDVLLYAYLDRNQIEQIIPVDNEAANATRTIDAVNVTFKDVKSQLEGVANNPTVTGRFSYGDNSGALTEAIKAYITGKDYDNFGDDGSELTLTLPIQRASAYAYQADPGWGWGQRLSYGLLQNTLQEILAEEIALQATLGTYAGLIGDLDAIVTHMANHVERMGDTSGMTDNLVFLRNYYNTLIAAIKLGAAIKEGIGESVEAVIEGVAELPPSSIGFSNDIGSGIRGSIKVTESITKTTFNAVGVMFTGLELLAERVKEELMAAQERNIGRVQSQDEIEGFLIEFENLSGGEAPLRANIGSHLQRLEILSQEYTTHLNTGFSLLRKREAFNKILAASVQKNRYQDMVLRLTRSEVSGKYQSAFNHAARYTWLAAQAYDYETSLQPGNPAAPGTLLDRIVGERQLGLWADGEPQVGEGGLAEILANLRDNFGVLKSQLGIDAPQSATDKMSLRTGLFRVGTQGAASDERWSNALKARCVDDVTAIPEFARYCRPFSRSEDGAQPGLVIRFSSHVEPGLNFFGRPLGAGDHSYSSANFATKIRGMGLWMENYNSAGLSTTPRAYLVPVGNDYLRSSSSGEPSIRMWNIEERRIPMPFVTNSSNLTSPGFIPSLDGVDGSFGALRRHGDFRIYHDDGDPTANDDEMEYDSRLIGRSVWNSDWILIIPGSGLHADPEWGLQQLTDTISDIKLHFTTYSHQGQ